MSTARWLLIGATLLFGISLVLPAIRVAGGPALSGYDVLEQGMGAWRDGVVAWYANPALLAALFLGWIRRYRWTLVVALAGLLLALSSYSAGTIAVSTGRSVPPFGFASGFYLWLVAFGAVILAAAIGLYRDRDRDAGRR